MTSKLLALICRLAFQLALKNKRIDNRIFFRDLFLSTTTSSEFKDIIDSLADALISRQPWLDILFSYKVDRFEEREPSLVTSQSPAVNTRRGFYKPESTPTPASIGEVND